MQQKWIRSACVVGITLSVAALLASSMRSQGKVAASDVSDLQSREEAARQWRQVMMKVKEQIAEAEADWQKYNRLISGSAPLEGIVTELESVDLFDVTTRDTSVLSRYEGSIGLEICYSIIHYNKGGWAVESTNYIVHHVVVFAFQDGKWRFDLGKRESRQNSQPGMVRKTMYQRPLRFRDVEARIVAHILNAVEAKD